MDVDLVLVPVTVADPAGRVITGLRAENFRVLEDRKPQRIDHFSAQEAPVSMCVVFDQSGSMADKLGTARAAVRELLERAHREDEVLLVAFDERPRTDPGFSRDPLALTNRLLWTTARGGTALFDAVYEGLLRLRTARRPRRALVVVSDGGDNESRHSRREVLALAAEADARIWALGIHQNPKRAEEARGALLLEELARPGGGAHFWARDRREQREAAARLAELMHHEYLLGYHPPPDGRAGKWRRVRVEVDVQPSRVYARSGYYGPSASTERR